MFQVDDPTPQPVAREVAADPLDPAAGSFVARFRAIPWAKYRELLRVYQVRSEVYSVLEREAPPKAETLEEGEEACARLRAWSEQLERARSALNASVEDLVRWGIAGHQEIVRTDGTDYPVVTEEVRWAGQPYTVLAPETVSLYLRLGILAPLGNYVVSFHEGSLPTTLEGFYKKESPPPPDGA